MTDVLNLFYAEPEPDRWLPLDRYPRRLVRRMMRGVPRPGGQTRVYLNLRAGLDRLGVPYRVNDYRHAARHPEELACIIGKPFLLDRVRWRNPILFGAAVFSHPVDDPDLLERLPVRRVLVPGEWCRKMFAQAYGECVYSWPVGIDTDAWAPAAPSGKDVDVLLYDKVLWERGRQEAELIGPVRRALEGRGLRVASLRYGSYREEDFRLLLARSRTMVFLCEHETQGIAYQQALSAGVPILAWTPNGPWRDPSYHPERVVFGPVTSVPYWDGRCGLTFRDAASFGDRLDEFFDAVRTGCFDPRAYILEHLTLERCAADYLTHVRAASDLGRDGKAAALSSAGDERKRAMVPEGPIGRVENSQSAPRGRRSKT